MNPRRSTLTDLFAHNDWGTRQILDACEPLGDAQLDRPFEMGPGSIRATLQHLWGAERLWLERWRGAAQPKFPAFDATLSLAGQRFELERVARERDALLQAADDPALHAAVEYRTLRGDPQSWQLGHLMLHVCNHGVHHRAQLMNMLRHVGAPLPKPGIDYIYYRLALGDTAPTPDFQRRTIEEYFAYGDWAMEKVFATCEEFSDAQLDRPFEMGLGTLRATLLHVRFAEQWWLENWTEGPGRPFPEMPVSTPLAEIRGLMRQTATARDAYLRTRNDAQLCEIVRAIPRPGVERRFPLGCTMLQLCVHGTLHRAQALNMLRRLGATPPGLDLILWLPSVAR